METPNVQTPNLPFLPSPAKHIAHQTLPTYPNGGRQDNRAPVVESELDDQAAVVANLPCLVYRCLNDAVGTALFVSAGCEQLTGYPATAFLNNQQQSLIDLIVPEEREQVCRQLAQAFAQRQPYGLEYRIIHATGVVRWVADRGVVVASEQNSGLWRDGLLVDISAQKETEAILTKANKELFESGRHTGEFLANVSHELRTPLSVILTIAESLQEGIYGPATPRQVEALARLRRGGRHLLGLVNDILDMAKMEVGKLTLHPERVDVEMVCTHSIQMVQDLAQNKQIKLCYENRNHIEWLWADEQRLRQILVNLLSNGIKFTPEGGQVGLQVNADPGEEVIRLTVWDTGIGIAQEETGKIFQPFVQLDSSLSRSHEGTGLGLSLVYHLTRLHRGSVTLETAEGQGSRFTITLPRSETESLQVQSTAHGAAGSPLAPPHLLALTTDETEGQQLMTALRVYNINVVATTDLRNAIALARQQQPSLILLDVPLPDYSLIETVHQLRRLAVTVQTPILALTTVQTPSHQSLWQQAGIATYIPKPTSFRQLATLIHSYCRPAAGI